MESDLEFSYIILNFTADGIIRRKAIDPDDLFAEVLGDEADDLLHIDGKDVGDDYGTREKDEMEYFGNSDDGFDPDDGFEYPDQDESSP